MKAEAFQTHMEAGKNLIKKPANLPDNTTTIIYDYQEVEAWFSTAEELIVRSFGKYSSQLSKWNRLQKKFIKPNRPLGYQEEPGGDPRANLVARINESIDLLSTFQHLEDFEDRGLGLSWNAGSGWEKILAVVSFSIGIIFLAILLGRGLQPSELPDRQFVLLRTILALAGGAFVIAIPGFITVEMALKNMMIRAVAAIVAFVLIYFALPAI